MLIVKPKSQDPMQVPPKKEKKGNKPLQGMAPTPPPQMDAPRGPPRGPSKGPPRGSHGGPSGVLLEVL